MSRKTDIQADLVGRTALPDWQAADELSALTVAATVDVPTKAIRRYLSLQGKIGGIEIAARGTDALAAVCQTVVRVLEPGAFDDLDFDDSAVLGKLSDMCDVLVSGGLISSGDKNAILALGNGQAPKYQPPVTAREVGLARGGA
jgi:hypothetical protein